MATVQEGFVTFVTLSRPMATVQEGFVTFVTLSSPVSTVQGSFVTFVTHFPVFGKTNTIVSGEGAGARW